MINQWRRPRCMDSRPRCFRLKKRTTALSIPAFLVDKSLGSTSPYSNIGNQKWQNATLLRVRFLFFSVVCDLLSLSHRIHLVLSVTGGEARDNPQYTIHHFNTWKVTAVLYLSSTFLYSHHGHRVKILTNSCLEVAISYKRLSATSCTFNTKIDECRRKQYMEYTYRLCLFSGSPPTTCRLGVCVRNKTVRDTRSTSSSSRVRYTGTLPTMRDIVFANTKRVPCDMRNAAAESGMSFPGKPSATNSYAVRRAPCQACCQVGERGWGWKYIYIYVLFYVW